MNRVSKRIVFLLLCASLCLSLSGCSRMPEEPFALFSIGLDNYRQVFRQMIPYTASEEVLLSPPAAPSSTVSAVKEEISSQAPLYAAYSYYLPGLTGEEAENFYALYEGIQAFEETITLPVPVRSEAVSDLMQLLTNECPELLQLSSRWVEHSNLLGYVVSVSPEYTIDAQTCQAQLQAITALLSDWQHTLTGQSAWEAELAIYRSIIENCTYSISADHCQSAYGALISGYAKCDGRAKAMVWALRSLGITSSVITGSNHAWVIAHIDGYDYNVDPTYDDNENPDGQQPICFAWFNVPESAVASNPYPADDFYQRRGYPSTVRWDANYHVRSGLWIPDTEQADTAAKDSFIRQLESILKSGLKGLVTLRFENPANYNAAAASYDKWVQTFINTHAVSCNMVSYDFSEQQMLAVQITFQ